MIRFLIVLALVLSACGDTQAPLAGATPQSTTALTAPPAATPSPTATGSIAPSHLPGTSVRVTVNGTDLRPGVAGTLADTGPSVVTLTFPVAMDRASVERWVTQPGTVSWTDDRTLTLTIPESASAYGFKIPEAVSKDGGTILDLLVVNLDHGPSVVASIFTVAELVSGAQAPKPGAPRISGGKGISVFPSPDGTRVLSYSAYATPGASPSVTAHVFDLATRTPLALALPATSVTPLIAWAGNDRIVVVGDHVWVSAIGGSTPRSIADLTPLGTLTAAAVSPNGGSLAVASADHLSVIDLASGAVRELAAHRDDCQPQVGPTGRIAWSKDERRIAVLECAATAPAVYRTRIIELAADRTVANVDGGGYGGIAALLTGEIAVSRDPGVTGEGAPTLWVIFSFDGVERTRFLSRGPALSPDGRYNLEPGCCAGEGFALRDLTAANAEPRGTAGIGQFLRDGRILVVTR